MHVAWLCSAHHFCHECYESWTARKASCPTCRAPVWSITRDYEFAKLIGAKCSHDPKTTAERDEDAKGPRRVQLPAPAGLTISNGTSGCVVTKVVRGNGGDTAGIKVGDVIVAVNGTEVRDHQQCVEFIERRCRVGDCEVDLKPRSAASELKERLLKTLTTPFERIAPRHTPRRPVLHTIAVDAMDDTMPRLATLSPVDARLAALAVNSPRGSPHSSPRSSPRRVRPSPLVAQPNPMPVP